MSTSTGRFLLPVRSAEEGERIIAILGQSPLLQLVLSAIASDGAVEVSFEPKWRGHLQIELLKHQIPTPGFSVGDTVAFSFETRSSTGAPISHNMRGVIERIGKRVSLRIVDDPAKHPYERERYAGTLKTVGADRLIPELI